MPLPLAILLSALFAVVVSLAVGRALLRRTRVELYRAEENALAFVIGAGVLSVVMFILCALHLVRRGVLVGVGVALIAVAVRMGAHTNVRAPFPPLSRGWKWLVTVCFSIFTILYFFNALAPEFSPDGSSYHLGFVSHYMRAHGFTRVTSNMYGNLSQGIELLYLFAFAFGRHSAAALVHYAFLVAATCAIASYGRRLGHPVAGWAAALLFYASPVVGMDGTTAYIDVAVAAILFTVFYLLQIWDSGAGHRFVLPASANLQANPLAPGLGRSTGLLILIGFVAGFGYAAKYTAFLAVPYAIGFVLWRERRLKPAVIVALASAILIGPWMIKNILWVHNPVSPMANRLFPNPYVHVSFEETWSRLLRDYQVPYKAQIPVEAAIRGDKLCGLVGPMFLLLPIALFGLRTSAGRRVMFAGALFGITYSANIGTRFLIPALPFFGLGIALALTAHAKLLGWVTAMHCLLSWPAVVTLYCGTYAWRLTETRYAQAMRFESDDKFLSRKYPEYQFAKLVATHTQPGDRILSFNGIPDAYIPREVLVNFQSGEGETMSDMVYTSFLVDFQPTFGQQFKFTTEPLRKIRVVQTLNAKGNEPWNMAELRVFEGDKELQRSQDWRLTAKPNPWDVQLAFDNNPVTRWRSYEPIRNGMYVEVDFGKTQSIDRVVVESSPECQAVKIKLEGMDASGRWKTLDEGPDTARLEPPKFMGKGAMRELKARNISFIFIRDREFAAPEMAEDPSAWGLTQVGKVFDGRLYRIDAGLPELMGN